MFTPACSHLRFDAIPPPPDDVDGYDDRPYEGRGWCAAEGSAAIEMLLRVAFFPEVHAALAALPPKLLDIGLEA